MLLDHVLDGAAAGEVPAQAAYPARVQRTSDSDGSSVPGDSAPRTSCSMRSTTVSVTLRPEPAARWVAPLGLFGTRPRVHEVSETGKHLSDK
jgi:hypothetical protein